MPGCNTFLFWLDKSADPILLLSLSWTDVFFYISENIGDQYSLEILQRHTVDIEFRTLDERKHRLWTNLILHLIGFSMNNNILSIQTVVILDSRWNESM